MEGLKVTIYLAGITFHGSHRVGFLKALLHSGLGERKVSSAFLNSSVCTDVSALTPLSVHTVLGLCLFHSNTHPPSLSLSLSLSVRLCLLTSPNITLCFCVLRKPTHWSKSLCNSNMKANIKTLSALALKSILKNWGPSTLWWLLNYTLMLKGSIELIQLLEINVFTFFFLQRRRKKR